MAIGLFSFPSFSKASSSILVLLHSQVVSFECDPIAYVFYRSSGRFKDCGFVQSLGFAIRQIILLVEIALSVLRVRLESSANWLQIHGQTYGYSCLYDPALYWRCERTC